MSTAPSPWNELCLYTDGETVQMPDGRCYRAKSSHMIKTVAANPESSRHNTFFKVLQKPNYLINAMCAFEFGLIIIQFWMLVLTNDWQHIVTFVLLMFANYLLFAKLFKDKIILGRIYEPSQEDILLMHQLHQER
uniref:Cation_ATPase_N domain-containing protein n=1 Tax=Caenorhabditis tropicalis TaxID=1561998 RepID=A0A1I7T7Q5_9PELO